MLHSNISFISHCTRMDSLQITAGNMCWPIDKMFDSITQIQLAKLSFRGDDHQDILVLLPHMTFCYPVALWLYCWFFNWTTPLLCQIWTFYIAIEEILTLSVQKCNLTIDSNRRFWSLGFTFHNCKEIQGKKAGFLPHKFCGVWTIRRFSDSLCVTK